MPQYGYGPVKRMDFDSSLTIPTTCGVPTLRTNITKKAAIAFDSCNNRFYQYNPKTSSWSIIGGGSDTFNLQQILNKGNSAIESLGAFQLSLSDNGGYSTSLSSQGLQSSYNFTNSLYYSDNFSINGSNNQTLAGGLYDLGCYLDASNVYGNSISLKAETTSTIDPFLQWYNGLYYQKLRPQYANGTTDIYMPYVNAVDTLATLSDVRSNKIDTTNKFVNQIYRTAGVDSIYYKIGSTTYAIKDSIGTGGGQNGRFGNDTATIMMAKVHNDAGVTLTNGKVVAFSTSGTSSDAPSVKLANNKADSTSATTFGFVSGTIAVNDTGWVILSGKIEKLNTSAYANGDIIYLDSISGQWTKSKPQAPYHLVYLGTVVKANAGNGSIYVKVQNGYEISELHDVKITSPINNQVLAYSDTQQLWKNRNIYSIVDTTTTVATKSNVALKLNISDTATMLNPYLRKIDTTNKFVNTITRTAGKDSIIFYIGGTRYAIKDSVGGGGGSAAGSTGYVQFNNAGAFAADSSLFWDNTNKRLGIGTTTPARTFVVVDDNKGTRGIQNDSYGNFSALLQYRRANGTLSSPTQVLANDDLGFFGASGYHSGGSFASTSSASIQFSATENYTSTALGARIIFGTTPNGSITRSERLRIDNDGNVLIGTTTNAGYKLDVNGTARVNGGGSGSAALYVTGITQATGSINASVQIGAGGTAGNLYTYRTTNAGANVQPYLLGLPNGSSTAGQLSFNWDNTNQLSFAAGNGTRAIARAGIGIASLTNTAGSESGDMIFLTQSGGTAMSEKMRITSGGGITLTATNTAAGTTGNQTINKPSGTVNIAAAGTSITVTNSLVTTSSIVFATIRTNDATAVIKNVVPASGSFTINLNAAATAETSIGFFVIN